MSKRNRFQFRNVHNVLVGIDNALIAKKLSSRERCRSSFISIYFSISVVSESFFKFTLNLIINSIQNFDSQFEYFVPLAKIIVIFAYFVATVQKTEEE